MVVSHTRGRVGGQAPYTCILNKCAFILNVMISSSFKKFMYYIFTVKVMFYAFDNYCIHFGEVFFKYFI